jgi:LAS superfamily LD-carboxypeptidase LdcB
MASGVALLVAAAGPVGLAAPPTGLPGCAPGDRPATNAAYDAWPATLVDPSHSLGRGYVPPDLERQRVGASQVTLRGFVHEPLADMVDAASAAGISVTVTSSYRSFDDQSALARDLGHEDDLVAQPGHSEHQLGTAVDLSGGVEWLTANSWRHGFVLSYPPMRSGWSCYRHEPWHFRYFGLERAAAIFRSGLSVREWLWQHHNHDVGTSSALDAVTVHAKDVAEALVRF